MVSVKGLIASVDCTDKDVTNVVPCVPTVPLRGTLVPTLVPPNVQPFLYLDIKPEVARREGVPEHLEVDQFQETLSYQANSIHKVI